LAVDAIKSEGFSFNIEIRSFSRIAFLTKLQFYVNEHTYKKKKKKSVTKPCFFIFLSGYEINAGFSDGEDRESFIVYIINECRAPGRDT